MKHAACSSIPVVLAILTAISAPQNTLCVYAQNFCAVFERFPFKHVEISIIPSASNRVVCDEEHGYLMVRTQATTGRTLEIAFVSFHADDGTIYYAYQEIISQKQSPCRRASLRFYVCDGDEWREVTYQVLPSVRISEFYGQRTVPNVIDSRGVMSLTPDDNAQGIGLGIDYTLPRKGEPIMHATLVYRCNDATPKKEYQQLYRSCKYKTIELLWNKENGWFLIGSKRAE
ncbi:MAG: hypothetical protein RML40_07030 [Bacteroidota bacterium]|nr:hypothetical protein [Candidatus Kapabacteria bacterium]MDW8220270.1 hypothetical protein [Bacteroidota bacterium]